LYPLLRTTAEVGKENTMKRNELNVNQRPAPTIAKSVDEQREAETFLSVPEELEPVIAPGKTVNHNETFLSVPEELEPVIAPGMTFGGGY
jgi:hypothetical protein